MTALFLALVLGIAAVSDLRCLRIPNWLTFPGMFLGITYFTISRGYEGLFYSLSGACAGMALLSVPFLLGGTGAGDVKLLGVVGSLLGPQGVFVAFLNSCIIGGIYALVLLSVNGLLLGTIKRYGLMLKSFLLTQQFFYISPAREEKEFKIRYGIVIAVGTIPCLLPGVLN